MRGERPDTLFVGDGGYLENSGIHSLLGVWEDIEPMVQRKNRAGGPIVVPIAVVVDNHYRSPAKSKPRGRVRELTGPPSANRAALIQAEALEQELAAAFSGPVPGQPDAAETGLPDKALRWFTLAPSTRPQIAAPLGWSLSRSARDSLDCQIDPLLKTGEDPRRKYCGGASATKNSATAALLGWLGTQGHPDSS